MKTESVLRGRQAGIRVAALFCILLFPALSEAQAPKWDVSLFRSINNSRSPFLDAIVGVNDYAVPPIAYGLPEVIAGVGLVQKNAYTFDTGVMLGLSEALAYGLYLPIKDAIVKRERPYVALQNVHTMHMDTADKYSMPSGHTTAAFAIATALTLRYPKPYVYIPAYAWAAFVGYGRVYLGLHYPSDVLAGALLGSACALAVHMVSPTITRLREKVLGDDLGIQLSAAPTLVNVRVTF